MAFCCCCGSGGSLLSLALLSVETCTSGNELTDDNVLFQTDQVVNLTFDSSLSQNLGCLLEGCS